MKKQWKVLIGVVGVLVLVAGGRWGVVVMGRDGGGRYESSPNKKYVASAMSLSEKKYWGGRREYLEFYIADDRGNVVRRAEIDDAKVDPVYWREDGRIEWAEDSAWVRFVSEDVTLVLPVR